MPLPQLSAQQERVSPTAVGDPVPRMWGKRTISVRRTHAMWWALALQAPSHQQSSTSSPPAAGTLLSSGCGTVPGWGESHKDNYCCTRGSSHWPHHAHACCGRGVPSLLGIFPSCGNSWGQNGLTSRASNSHNFTSNIKTCFREQPVHKGPRTQEVLLSAGTPLLMAVLDSGGTTCWLLNLANLLLQLFFQFLEPRKF